MRTVVVIIAVILTASFTSCKRVLFIAYGVKFHPKHKTEKQINKAISKYGFGNHTNYALTEDGFNYLLAGKLHNMNTVLLFDKAGNRVELKRKVTCSNDYHELIKHFKDTSICHETTAITIDTVKKYMRNLDGSVATFSEAQKPYTAIVTWGTPVGRLNKETSREFYQALLRLNDPDIQIYFWDFDKRTFWEE